MQAKLTTLARQLTLAAVVCALADAAAAHDLTLDECLEGSDFIKHAAMSRDYGLTREAFLDRMEGDLLVIQQFPPQLRWFVQDPDDETLLTQAAKTVFDSPREPESHQSDFLAACVERVGRHAGTDSDKADLNASAAELPDASTDN
jgi:hypothetical protein